MVWRLFEWCSLPHLAVCSMMSGPAGDLLNADAAPLSPDELSDDIPTRGGGPPDEYEQTASVRGPRSSMIKPHMHKSSSSSSSSSLVVKEEPRRRENVDDGSERISSATGRAVDSHARRPSWIQFPRPSGRSSSPSSPSPSSASSITAEPFNTLHAHNAPLFASREKQARSGSVFPPTLQPSGEPRQRLKPAAEQQATDVHRSQENLEPSTTTVDRPAAAAATEATAPIPPPSSLLRERGGTQHHHRGPRHHAFMQLGHKGLFQDVIRGETRYGEWDPRGGSGSGARGGTPKLLYGLPKIVWVILADVLAMTVFLTCIPVVLSCAKRRRPLFR